MAYPDRREVLFRLERIRGSKVLVYLLSDREVFPPGSPGFTTQLSTEPQLLIVDHLRALGEVQNLDLFLYTRGGETNAVWPLVALLREHCRKFSVIVPYRAHSGGTLICLGANELILTTYSELSPIDPTTGNQFNPQDPQNPQNRFGISVEDVASYFALAKERAGVEQEPYKLEVLKQLTEKVHPLALGNVQRVTNQIKHLAQWLLELHLDRETDAVRIEKIVKALTEEFFSHVHAINREQAIPLLGEWARPPTAEEAPVIWELFNAYANTLRLRERFSIPEFMGDDQMKDLTVVSAFLETTELSHTYCTDMKVIQRPNLPPGMQLQLPPGGPIPLPEWAGRAYDFSVKTVGWKQNADGI